VNVWNDFQKATKGQFPSPQEAARIWNAWAKGTWPDKLQSMNYHLKKHGGGRTLGQYTADAQSLWNSNRNLAQWGQWNPQWQPSFRLKVGGQGGYYTQDGQILTYWD
jgi:hypothetical protein